MISLGVREKRFGVDSPPVLGELRLDVGEGGFTALLGPSGSGKTTILRLLAGLDDEFEGERQTKGAKPRVGFLFQEARLMPWLTALENVALVVAGDRDRAQEALASVSLDDAQKLYPHQLSGGMQRRVALARAIVGRPELLLLDEPFVSLDQPNTQLLQELLLAYWVRERPAIVLVSHDLDEALTLADRVLFLGGSPARVVLDEVVDLDRPRGASSPGVRKCRETLLSAHPGLLSGVLGPEI